MGHERVCLNDTNAILYAHRPTVLCVWDIQADAAAVATVLRYWNRTLGLEPDSVTVSTLPVLPPAPDVDPGAIDHALSWYGHTGNDADGPSDLEAVFRASMCRRSQCTQCSQRVARFLNEVLCHNT